MVEGVNRVAAEIAVDMLLQHQHLATGPREQQARHHSLPGRRQLR